MMFAHHPLCCLISPMSTQGKSALSWRDSQATACRSAPCDGFAICPTARPARIHGLMLSVPLLVMPRPLFCALPFLLSWTLEESDYQATVADTFHGSYELPTKLGLPLTSGMHKYERNSTVWRDELSVTATIMQGGGMATMGLRLSKNMSRMLSIIRTKEMPLSWSSKLQNATFASPQTSQEHWSFKQSNGRQSCMSNSLCVWTDAMT
jgi:hypothetical protein